MMMGMDAGSSQWDPEVIDSLPPDIVRELEAHKAARRRLNDQHRDLVCMT
jgi:hypothetical protein